MVKRAIRDPVHHAHPPATPLKLFRLLPTALRQRLESQPVLAAILVNIGWLFVDKVLRMGGGLLVAIWVARYLGPEQFLLAYSASPPVWASMASWCVTLCGNPPEPTLPWEQPWFCCCWQARSPSL